MSRGFARKVQCPLCSPIVRLTLAGTLYDGNFLVGQAVEGIDKLVDLFVGRVDLSLIFKILRVR